MTHILSPLRPDPVSVEHSIRRAERELQKIELLKSTFRAQVETLVTNARALGVTEAETRVARDSAEDVLSDLFWEMAERIVVWFSCGTPSAVTGKLVLAKYGQTHDVKIARILIPEEHRDNDRFATDCERWYGAPIVNLRSAEYSSCTDVWTRTRYMAGVHGARCTTEMKKAVRFAFEREWRPDLQAFGYRADEQNRAEIFRANNPEITLLTPLIDAGLGAEDCHAITDRAGIEIPEMYRLGYRNNNCIGCVKAQSPTYWNRVRRTHPEVFDARAILSRELGVRLVKTTTGARPRMFLDELPPDMGATDQEPAMDCSLLCHAAEGEWEPLDRDEHLMAG